MELMITIKGNKYMVQDKKASRLLYTVKKKGFGAEECFEAFLHGKIRILRRKDFEPVRAPD